MRLKIPIAEMKDAENDTIKLAVAIENKTTGAFEWSWDLTWYSFKDPFTMIFLPKT